MDVCKHKTRIINVLLYSSSNIRFEILCDFEDQSQLSHHVIDR